MGRLGSDDLAKLLDGPLPVPRRATRPYLCWRTGAGHRPLQPLERTRSRLNQTGQTHMMKHWTSKLATLVSGACVIAALAVPMAQVTARTVWDGMYSAAQAARGKALYDAQCAFCHQPDLRGQGFAPALIEDAFASRWQDGNLGDLLTIVMGTHHRSLTAIDLGTT